MQATARVPIHADPEYPEVLREIADVMERELRAIGIETDLAGAVAETVTEHVRANFGGTPIYIAKGMTMRQRRRMWEIWEAFTGGNHIALARRYGMSLSQIYRVLQVARHEIRLRQQPDLFGDLAHQQPG